MTFGALGRRGGAFLQQSSTCEITDVYRTLAGPIHPDTFSRFKALPNRLEALRDYVAGAVSHFKVPAVWRVMESLPMTASGKVRKHELAQMVGDA